MEILQARVESRGVRQSTNPRDVKTSAKALHDFAHELSSVISHQVLGERMILEDILEKRSSHCLCLPVWEGHSKWISGEDIDGSQNPLVSLTGAVKLSHEVNGKHVHGRPGKQRAGLEIVAIGAGLSPLAWNTGLDPSSNMLGKSRPIELTADVVSCPITSDVTSDRKPVVMIQDGGDERPRYIHPICSWTTLGFAGSGWRHT